MDLIRELVYVLKLNPSRSIDMVLPEGSKMRKLYNAIAKNKIQTDEEAAQLIYESSAKDKKYLMLKKNLRDRLIDILITSEPDVEEESKFHNIRFQLKKQLIVAQKLLENNVFHNAENILIDVKFKARKNFLYEVLLDALFQLRHMYMLMGFPDETRDIHSETIRVMSQFHIETEANGAFELVKSRIKFRKGNDFETANLAQEQIQKLRVFSELSDSPYIKLNILRLQLILNKQTNNVAANESVLHEFQREISHNDFLETKPILHEIQTEWAQYYLQSSDFKKALQHIERALALSTYEAFNIFEVKSLEFEYHIKKKEYQKAAYLLHEMHRKPQFDYLHKFDKASWLLREAFLFYLAKKEGIDLATPNFKIRIDEKFLQEMLQPINKDKTGWNLWYMILKLYIVREYKTSNYENESNNLAVYTQRYIKDTTESRTQVFLKMIAKAAKRNFSDAFFAENPDISAHLNEKSNFFDNCEFISYADLWRYFQK